MKCRLMAAAVAFPMLAGSAHAAQNLVIWHDKGEDGIALVEKLSGQFAKTHPDVKVTSVSMPTEQWFSKSVAALNTANGPDILFNDSARFVTVQQATGKLCNLRDVIDGITAADRAFLNEADISAGVVRGEPVIVPFQRVIAGWGVRKSWLEKVGEKFPETWEDTLRVARKFQEEDPDGNGRKDTFGMALQGGGASSLVSNGTKLFTVAGNRAPHDLIDTEGKILIKNPEIARPLEEYLKIYTDYKLASPETINHGFTDMYQLIEGGRAGMFRAGNWNVAKWDREGIKGDFIVGPYPAFSPDKKGAMLVSSIRGMAVPCNGRNVDLAREFVGTLLGKEAQQSSLDHMGGVVRTDLDISRVTPSLRSFIDGTRDMQIDDFMSAKYDWYNELQENYYQALVRRISDPSEDFGTWLDKLATELQAKADQLRK